MHSISIRCDDVVDSETMPACSVASQVHRLSSRLSPKGETLQSPRVLFREQACYGTELLEKLRKRRESEMCFESTPSRSTAAARHDLPLHASHSGVFENKPNSKGRQFTPPPSEGTFENTPRDRGPAVDNDIDEGVFENVSAKGVPPLESVSSGIFENTPTMKLDLPDGDNSGIFENSSAQKVDAQGMSQCSGVFENAPSGRRTSPLGRRTSHGNTTTEGLDGYGPRRQPHNSEEVADVNVAAGKTSATIAEAKDEAALLSNDTPSDASDESDEVNHAVDEMERPSGSGFEQVANGGTVRILKAGRQFMELGVVTDVNWGGLVKVSMESGDVKAYLSHEIVPINSSRQYFPKGVRVQVVKPGTLYGSTGVVSNPLFGFRTKVTLDADGTKRSFLSHELTRC